MSDAWSGCGASWSVHAGLASGCSVYALVLVSVVAGTIAEKPAGIGGTPRVGVGLFDGAASDRKNASQWDVVTVGINPASCRASRWLR